MLRTLTGGSFLKVRNRIEVTLRRRMLFLLYTGLRLKRMIQNNFMEFICRSEGEMYVECVLNVTFDTVIHKWIKIA
jgi:hypothetical protein